LSLPETRREPVMAAAPLKQSLDQKQIRDFNLAAHDASPT
jgi:hypothetical protein